MGMNKLTQSSFLRELFCFLMATMVSGLFAVVNVDAAAPKGYSKTGYTSFSDVIRQSKADMQAEKTQGTVTVEKATVKTLAGKKKVKTLFLCTMVKKDDAVVSLDAVSYIQKGNKIYSRTWGDGLLKPEYISKNSKYIFAHQYAGIKSGQKEMIRAYSASSGTYSQIGLYSTTGKGTNIKKRLKKLQKEYKTGTIKKIAYKKIASKTEDSEKHDTKTDPENVPAASVASFDAIMANFSVNMLKGIASTESADANQLISADSIAMALAMAENGAAGDTLAEMISALSPGMGIEEYCTNLGNFNKRITSSSDVIMHVADSMWMKSAPGIQIKDDFISKNRTYFGADSYLEPFDSSTVFKINDWVNANTNQMIPKIIDQIPPEAIMYLINAVAFEGEWAKQFKNQQITENQKFTGSDGRESQVTMLSDKESSYVELNGGVGFVKPYKGNDFAFVGLLPPVGMSNADYLKSFTGQEFINSILNKKSDKDVYIKLPEFSYDYASTLNPYLQSLGIQKAFTPEADFSGMVENSQLLGVKIDSVLHKTHIELDRNGTKAAAVTAVMMAATSVMPVERERLDIYLDRPFVYAIVDLQTGVPIFMGDVNKL